MNVGLVTTSYPRHEADLAGNFVRGFARALTRLGHTVEVLAPQPSEPSDPPVDEGISLTCIPYMRPRFFSRTFYGAGAPDNLARDPLAKLGVAPFAASLLAHIAKRRTRWDAVVSHWALPCALLVGRMCPGIPHVAVMHSGDVHALSRLPLASVWKREIAKHATTLWFVSQSLRALFGDTGDVNVVVSPMGITLPEDSHSSRSQLRTRLGITRDTALTMSRLVPIKGIDVAMRALAQCPEMDLVVAGDGPERASLERYAPRNVRFVGEVSGVAKVELFRACDMLLYPSRTLPSGRAEGVPTAVLEAMSYGLPIVATRSGGIPDVLTHDVNALLVQSDDARSLAAAMQLIAAKAGLGERLAAHALRDSAHYSWTALLPTLERALTHG